MIEVSAMFHTFRRIYSHFEWVTEPKLPGKTVNLLISDPLLVLKRS